MDVTRRTRQALLERIAADRLVPRQDLVIVETRTFPKNRWNDIGTIEVIYNTAGHHAIYGFNALARVNCYAD